MTVQGLPSARYWPDADIGADRVIVPGLLDAGWTRRAGGYCGDPMPCDDACRELGQWGHPHLSEPERPVCAPHARDRQQTFDAQGG